MGFWPLGGTPHMKGVGMLVASLRGVNFGFWSHLGCSGQNAIIFSREALVKGCTRKNIKIYIYLDFENRVGKNINSFYYLVI